MILRNYNKYESYIRIGHTATGSPGNYVCSDLQNFPTPAGPFKRILHDVDVDAYTDLDGYTHRNRKRHDVEDFTLVYPVLSDADEQFILNMISPEWIYVELTDKKTGTKKVHKMYASDKEWEVYNSIYNSTTGKWEDMNTAFQFSLTEE